MFNVYLSKLLHIGERILTNPNCKHVIRKIALPTSANTVKFCTAAQSSSEALVASICKDDPVLGHKLQVIFLETDVLRQDGHNVPSPEFMVDKHWQELLKLESRAGRRKYLSFLFKLEKSKENRMAKKEQKRAELVENYKPNIEGAFRYDLGHNNILLRIYDTTMNQLYNNKLVQAMQFGQKLVVDCGFHDKMTQRENRLCAKQLTLLFSDNRFHADPFDIHFCNADFDSELMAAFKRHVPTMNDPAFPMNVHQASYLDLFDRQKLVYLTPHCRETLDVYDHDAIYIIGGIVDKVKNEPLSMAKAKREQIRMAKLPLDRYLSWGSGSGKSLTLNHMVSILLDVQTTGDWEFALRHVPRRKLVDNTPGAYISTRSRGLPYDEADRVKKRDWKPKPDANGKFQVKNVMFD